MPSRISDRLHQWARGWLVLAAIVAFMVLANLPLADPALVSESLDGRFAYSPEEAFSAITSYGDAGRVQMIWIHLADFLLIALYTLMFSLILSWLFQRGFPRESKVQRLNLIPIFGGLCDVMENVWILILLLAYPARPAALGWLSTIFTTGKYVMGIPIVLLLLLGLVRAAMNRFRLQV